MENSLAAPVYGMPTGTATIVAEGTVTAASVIATSPTSSACPIQQPPPVHQSAPVPRRSPSAAPRNPPKRARKDRGPNWLPQEVTALVNAKRELFLQEIDIVDGRDLMNPDSTKWQRISEEVMKCGFCPCLRDGAACKTKWNQIIPEYKRIADFFARTGRNGADYWELSAAERKSEGLPRSFPQDIFFNINEWYGSRPSMQPPHTRDLLCHDDGNFQNNRLYSSEDKDDANHQSEDAMDIADEVEVTDGTGGHTPPRSQQPSQSTASEAPPSTRRVSCNGRQRVLLPPGVTPHLISSSDTSDSNANRCVGNTAIRRKSLSGHNLIAEATRASGDVMAGQLREMVEASRDLERSKIEVQLKLFSEQMDYQREKDRRLHDSSCIANDNARLAIEKQGEVVKVLSQLSSVLSLGFGLPTGRPVRAEPQAAPPFLGHETSTTHGSPVSGGVKQHNNMTMKTTGTPDSATKI